jgi:Fibrobacter succinogenes major domain (Fib_succ_major).
MKSIVRAGSACPITKLALTAALGLAITFTLTACEEKEAANSGGGTLTDSRDGKTYKTVKIGEQVWFAENLNYAEKGSKCYDNNETNCQKYGRLYDWETAMKACPSGWHLPSNAEWDKLGTSETAGKDLKAKSGWPDDKVRAINGEDKYGFTALPGGYGYSGGYFDNVGSFGYWWSTSEIDSSYIENNRSRVGSNYDNYAYDRRIDYDNVVRKTLKDKGYLFSVRCLQDGTGTKQQGGSKPSDEERECPYKEGPIITIKEAIFLEEAEDHEGRCETIFRLPNGETIGFIGCAAPDDAKKGDKVSVTYQEELDSFDPECWNLKSVINWKKIGESANTLTDTRDKKTYWTAKIGKRVWMAENLNIEIGKSYCYNNDEDYCKQYGRLYDWETARKACPKGWHLPSREEWEAFAVAAGLKKKPDASCYVGTVWTGVEKLKADNGFAAQLGGSRSEYIRIEMGDEWEGDVGVSGKWWASGIDEEGGVTNFEINQTEASLCTSMSRSGSTASYSVRCIKN